MSLAQFIQIAAAVCLGNLLTFCFVYAVWRMKWAERHLGVKDGAKAVPAWVPLLMLPALFVCVVAVASLS